MTETPKPVRVTWPAGQSILHGGPHDGMNCRMEPHENLRVVVDGKGLVHSYNEGMSWFPVEAPLSLYGSEQYGIADDPARPGVWRFWHEWHYVAELPPEMVEMRLELREELTAAANRRSWRKRR